MADSGNVIEMKSDKDRLQLDIIWGMFTVLEYLVSEITEDMGELARPVQEQMRDIKLALTDLEGM